jgi:hypothetical protein
VKSALQVVPTYPRWAGSCCLIKCVIIFGQSHLGSGGCGKNRNKGSLAQLGEDVRH